MDISLFQIIVTLALYVLRMVVDLKMAKPQNNVIKDEVAMKRTEKLCPRLILLEAGVDVVLPGHAV